MMEKGRVEISKASKKRPLFHKPRKEMMQGRTMLDGVKTVARKTRRPMPAGGKPAVATPHFSVKTILVPVDFSPPSLQALQYACPLAAKFGARVHLVYVNDLAVREPLLATTFRLGEDFGHTQRRRLQSIGANCSASIGPEQCHVRSGYVDEQIGREARVLHADLIVIATHGYSGLKHAMLGSATEKVVRRSPCPVLVVREPTGKFANVRHGARPRFHHILVPTDFSEPGRDALQYAIAFARRVGAQLTIANIIYPQYYATNPDYTLYDFGELFEETRAAAKRDMAELVRTTAFRGVPFKTRIEVGHPVNNIIELAAKSRADFIVTSTHGRTGLKRALMGSVAERVIRYASCPVLVVPRATEKHREGVPG
jgi:nucleotide-binding universal stress UspA family protein